MDIYEQIRRFDELIAFVQNELPKYATEVAANDLVALIVNRVINTGKDADGNLFSSYSDNPIAAGKLWGKSRTQAAESKVRALAKAKGALSYKAFRELNNLKTDKKNFEFTGEMFRKFGIIREAGNGSNFVITLGGTTEEAQRKIDANSAQEGADIIAPSKSEEEFIKTSLADWLNYNADRILNG